ncbi:hypothetical protein D9M70_596190 [compost metagenome]
MATSHPHFHCVTIAASPQQKASVDAHIIDRPVDSSVVTSCRAGCWLDLEDQSRIKTRDFSRVATRITHHSCSSSVVVDCHVHMTMYPQLDRIPHQVVPAVRKSGVQVRAGMGAVLQ